jgi:MFS family permease
MKPMDEQAAVKEAGEAKSLPARLAPLLLLFALALIPRCLGLTWGLPNAGRWYSYHPDESTRQIVGAVVNIIQGDFNPHFFNYPSLTVYATWVFYTGLAMLGLGTNAVGTQYPWPVIHDIILAGRIFSVLCGALTAPLVFLIARRLGLGKWAFLAAVLAALAPGHVQHSHFATVDVPATFFVTLCIYLSLRATNTKGFLLAALVAGLAAGTKYNAGMVALVPLLTLWLRREPNSGKPILLSLEVIALTCLGFLISTPYALIAPGEFWGDRAAQNGFAFELLDHPHLGSGDVFQGTGNGWWYHLTFNLPFLLTWPLVIGATVGIVFAAKKREFRPTLVFLALFFLSLGFSQVRYMRYLLPLAPFLCLLAAYGASQLRFPKVWGVALSLFAVMGCSNVVWPFISIDPRDEAAQALQSRPPGIALAHNPWFYTPPFQPQGLNMPVANVPVTGFDAAAIKGAEAKTFVASEYEWRETVRLQPSGSLANFLQSNAPQLIGAYKTHVPLALPGRDFVPHDFLYTNPETRLYNFGSH